MSKKMIWVLITLMSIALIGISGIQYYWIRTAINTNEARFKNGVYDILNKVALQLRVAEKKAIYKATFGSKSSLKTFSEDLELEFEKENIRRMFNERDLAERIQIQQIEIYIKQGLTDKNINEKFKYGVFSITQKSFILENGHYTVPAFNTKILHSNFDKGLYNSEFKVTIFNENGSIDPGLLMIYFPERSSFTYVSWIVIISLIFTFIILFTFIFTIYDLLRQKKLTNMKNDFINNMTHEFKTPIATISLASDNIMNANIINDPAKIGRFIGIIKQENSRMLNQVEKVLQIALIDKEKLKLSITSFDLHEIIKVAKDHINLQIEKKEGNVYLKLSASPSIMMGDITHVTNIIHNLLDNANKYTENNPEIWIKTTNTANGIQVAITDNGIGMTKDQKKQIFEKFYRATSGNLHDVKGFGLGLSYVKAMMLAHKGSIEVDSEFGKGSTFTLFFPYEQYNLN